MKEPIPDALPEGGLIENRDGLTGALYDDLLACIERSWPKLAPTDVFGAIETVKLEVWARYRAQEDDAEDDE